jgi:hypothetical protein
MNMPGYNGFEPPQSGSAVSDPGVVDYHTARLQRIIDYQIEALAKPQALEANLGCVNGGLLRVSYYLEETLDESIAAGPRTADRLERMRPVVDMQLRVARQIQRFAQIETRAQQGRNGNGQNAHSATTEQSATPLEAPVAISPSEDSAV